MIGFETFPWFERSAERERTIILLATASKIFVLQLQRIAKYCSFIKRLKEAFDAGNISFFNFFRIRKKSIFGTWKPKKTLYTLEKYYITHRRNLSA